MLGIVLGTLCLVGLVKVLRHGHHHRFGHGCGHGGGYGGHGGWGEGYGGGGCGGRRGWGGPGGWQRGGWGGGWGGGSCGGRGSWNDHGEGFGGPYRQGHGDGGFGGPFGFARGRRFLGFLFGQLQTTPTQEEEILAAIRELKSVGKSVKEDAKATRKDLAKAMRAESFDEVVLGETAAKLEGHVESMRKAFFATFGRIHATLDPKQRERLADLLERGPRPWARGFGHDRGRGPANPSESL